MRKHMQPPPLAPRRTYVRVGKVDHGKLGRAAGAKGNGQGAGLAKQPRQQAGQGVGGGWGGQRGCSEPGLPLLEQHPARGMLECEMGGGREGRGGRE